MRDARPVCEELTGNLFSMAKSHQAKSDTLESLREKLSRMKALVFTHYQGLTVKDVTNLRKQLREEGVDLLVAKKTLLRKALTEAGLDGNMVDQLSGDVAIAFGYNDEVTAAKLLQKYSKEKPVVKLLGGVVEGQALDAKQVVALAKLPSREELIAQTVWVIKGPLTGFVNVMAGNLRGLVQVLSAIKDRQPAPSA